MNVFEALRQKFSSPEWSYFEEVGNGTGERIKALGTKQPEDVRAEFRNAAKSLARASAAARWILRGAKRGGR